MWNRLQQICLAGGVVMLGALIVGQAPAAAKAGKAGLRYNQVQFKAAHNSYHQKTDMPTQLRDLHLRSIEFDLHASKGKLISKEKAPAGDFLVFHKSFDDFSNCHLLSQCFEAVAAFHREQPDHEVITIFFDMEGIGQPGHTKSDLYGVMRKKLGDAIFTPGDLLAACPGAQNLQEAVTKSGCGWPLMDDLKGRIILVVSDGREDIKKDGYDLAKDLLFLVNKGGDSSKMHADPNIVFFNMSGPNPFIAEVKQAGFVSRSYRLNDKDAYLKAKSLGANHLATDMIDPKLYPWSNTVDEQGHPFQKVE
jgi:hypothetical protein